MHADVRASIARAMLESPSVRPLRAAVVDGLPDSITDFARVRLRETPAEVVLLY